MDLELTKCKCCQRLRDCCICNYGGAKYYGEECPICRPLAQIRLSAFRCSEVADFLNMRADRASESEHQSGQYGNYLHNATALRRAALILEEESISGNPMIVEQQYEPPCPHCMGTGENHSEDCVGQ